MAERIPYLGISLAKLTVHEYVDTIRRAIEEGRSLTFTYAHFHTMNLIQGSARVRDVFGQIDVVTPDGVAVLWSTRLLGRPLFRDHIIVNEYAMAVLGPEACRRGWSFFLFGGDVGIPEQAAERLRKAYPGLCVTGTRHGQLRSEAEVEEVVTTIARLRPTILLVGLGQPRQEEWMTRYRSQLGVTAIVGVGGYLEKLARRDTIYPPWVNITHLYWLYRFITEPGRVWKRYSIGAIRFAWLLVQTMFRSRGTRERPGVSGP